jgi:hypothetical protein
MSALLATTATLAASLMVLGAGPASAIPADTNWGATGPGTISAVNSGLTAAPTFTYRMDPAGLSTTRTWTFQARATQTGTVTVPYTWQGSHAFHSVRATLEVFDSTGSETIVNDFNLNCCAPPSVSFIYGGIREFQVVAGQDYGFRLSGSNFDENNFLQGTFTLSTKPYLDRFIGTDNRDWWGAKAPDVEEDEFRSIGESGEARWFKFPVVPGQNIKVTLGNLGKDYDLALYGDIGAAYDELSGDADASRLSGTSSTTGVAASQLPNYPTEFTDIPTSSAEVGQQFAPRIYAPRIYAPRIYAPRIYAPRIYAPRIYAPDSYIPEVADESFQQAYTAAQNQTLLAVSDRPGTTAEEVTASSGNTNGNFYVRVQGHTEQDFAPNSPFTVTATATGSGCTTLDSMDDPDDPLTPALMPPIDPDAPASPDTVIVTDSVRTNYAQDEAGNDIGSPTSLLADLNRLAGATDGVVVDVAHSPRVQALWDQAEDQFDCPYAVNLVAGAIDQIVASFRNPGSSYVVLAGGDEVVPFFRYPDVSGLGQESQFAPPMRPNTAAFGSLSRDQVLSQDAYGSDTEVTIAGVTLPVPDLAVGRLVKTDQEIGGQIDNYFELAVDEDDPSFRKLPTPTSSLVTGYDFLTDAADAVNEEFAQALGSEAPPTAAETLIDRNGDAIAPWNATQLEQKLLGGTEHDLVFLAGHFSANNTVAADFLTDLNADELAPDGPYAGHLKNTLVLSAGCHSGYNIVDDDAVINVTETNDWTQRMAQQGALLVGGTGYQYGDTDFLEYSERLYLELARRLHEAPADGNTLPIAIGKALVSAKQDYLAGLIAVSGIDQKALLQATLYGLPMTGFDAPGREPLRSPGGQVAPGGVSAQEPGASLGLRYANKTYETTSTPDTKTVSYDPHPDDEVEETVSEELTWLDGADGVFAPPALPAVPKQIENVGVDGEVLRGVGFRGGLYHDETGVLPLTGAPAIEASTPNTTFESDTWFPQSLTTANYFGTLGGSGRTSLILTPAQYRSDEVSQHPTLPTSTQRAYDHMRVRLFYTGPDSAGAAAQAAPPSITDVRGTYVGSAVTFSAQVTGDPAAGVQQVWVTWTGPTDANGDGAWVPVDLAQDPNDSTRWTGTLDLQGTSPADVRFLVSAVNGAGAVAFDTAAGNGYGLDDASALPATVTLETDDPTEASPLGVTAKVVDTQQVPVAGRVVRFTVSRGGEELYIFRGTTGANGRLELGIPSNRTDPPVGDLRVVGELLKTSGVVEDTDQTDTHVADTPVSISATSPSYLVALPGAAYPVATPLTATVSDDYGTVPDYPVRFAFPLDGATARFVGDDNTRLDHVDLMTGADGSVAARPSVALLVPGAFSATITAGNATALVPMAVQYGFGAFVSPVAATTSTGLNGTTPIKIAAFANGTKLSTSQATALVANGQVQVRWFDQADATKTWMSSGYSVTYNAAKGFFQADLKASAAGMQKNHSYTVEVRLIVNPFPDQIDEVPLQSDYDLGGSSTFTLKVTK